MARSGFEMRIATFTEAMDLPAIMKVQRRSPAVQCFTCNLAKD
jgi:hypothetical protein